MKKALLLQVFSFLLCGQLIAQDLRLHLNASHVFDDGLDSYHSSATYFKGTINGGFRWGGGVEYMLLKNYGVSLNYFRRETELPIAIYHNGGVRNVDFDLTNNWVLLSATRYLPKKNIEPFGGAEFGLVIFDVTHPESGNSESSTRFAWGLTLGTHVYLNHSLGLKFQADLRSAVRSVGGSFYLGTGGAGVGLSSDRSTVFQFGLGGGLVIQLLQGK